MRMQVNVHPIFVKGLFFEGKRDVRLTRGIDINNPQEKKDRQKSTQTKLMKNKVKGDE